MFVVHKLNAYFPPKINTRIPCDINAPSKPAAPANGRRKPHRSSPAARSHARVYRRHTCVSPGQRRGPRRHGLGHRNGLRTRPGPPHPLITWPVLREHGLPAQTSPAIPPAARRRDLSSSDVPRQPDLLSGSRLATETRTR